LAWRCFGRDGLRGHSLRVRLGVLIDRYERWEGREVPPTTMKSYSEDMLTGSLSMLTWFGEVEFVEVVEVLVRYYMDTLKLL